MNDVDTDKHRHTTGNEEGPDHRHNDDERMLDAPPDMLHGDASGRVLTILSALDELGTDYWLEAGGGSTVCWVITPERTAPPPDVWSRCWIGVRRRSVATF